MNPRIYEKNFRGRKIQVEIGTMAKQANGSVLVRYEDTVVLTASVMNNNTSTMDFFPLTVLYQEKLYSVGKIPGGFIKREGRPSENATLISRLIDRPIRPLFEEGFRNEVQVINTVLSVDKDNSPEMAALLGSSLSLLVSDIPFTTPVALVTVGRVGNDFIINPTLEQLEQSDIELIVAGTSDAINMVEAGCSEVSEEDMVNALMFAHDGIKELIEFEKEIYEKEKQEKKIIELKIAPILLKEEVITYIGNKMKEVITIFDKQLRQESVDNLKEEAIEYFIDRFTGDIDIEIKVKNVKSILNDLEATVVRDLIIKDNIRPDGRGLDEIRSLSGMVDILPRPHGSALFTRGQTQVLSVTTLGAMGEHQVLDGLEVEEEKRFMHHYNFPQFSVGETGRYGAPGRREVGHGALGERAMLQVLPNEEEFPYTIRVVSEVLESNGSSSQASICAGIMSLMAAGVPIKAPVAGIAMGLITDENNNYKILTDIQGLEDHMGDMDFKVAGTKKGICALQMDIKIKGVTKQILSEALAQAKEARLQILEVMESIIPNPRKELSKYAPKIKQIKINPEKIKDVIGRGGETITKLILEVSNVTSVNDINAVKIDIEDDGRVIIYHTDYEIIDKAIKRIEDLTKEVEVDTKYLVKVTTVTDFGCFCELWPGLEGLVHVSELDHKRIEKPSDIVKVGDTFEVLATGYDKKGRLNLSRKALLPKEVNVKDVL